MVKDSESRVYFYIKEVLKDLGWDIKNPAKGGDVYEKSEFVGHDTFLERALGGKIPDETIVIPWEKGAYYWVVEAKPSHKQMERAVSEAQSYAAQINASAEEAVYPACFATGIAGSPDDSFLVETHFWNGERWEQVSINDYATTGFLTKDQCLDILNANAANINNFDADPERFLRKANAINDTLHNNGIAVGDRAKVMGALLLALADDTPIRIHDDPTKMVSEVNGNIRHILTEHGKGDFADTIGLTLPATSNNHNDYRKSIVETIQHLREMNVRSAINSNDDALGKFYETFLKYANGAKEMGIVLTPRHIAQFGVEVLGVTANDKVYDPTCGTGGFLVAAMDYVRQSSTDEKYGNFKADGIWGVEKEDAVYGLALVNMIFRGDGKSGLHDGDCFEHDFWRRDGVIYCSTAKDTKKLDGATRPFSRVFMNPPYKLEKNKETRFVDYALNQMNVGGLLFAVLPAVNINGRNFDKWRRELLARHSVKAVIKFDKNVFYPVQEGTYGLVVEAHNPHVMKDPVFMGILFDDNHRPRRSKVLSAHTARDNMERMTGDLKNFILGKPPDVMELPREQKIIALKISNDKCELSPEAYIENESRLCEGDVALRAIDMLAAKMRVAARRETEMPIARDVKDFPLEQFIEDIKNPPLRALKDLPPGPVPGVSATAENNGISGWYDVPEGMILRNLISVSKTHNTKPCQAFWHPYDFTAISTVYLFQPIADFSNEALIYLCEAITDTNAWRYDYARPVKMEELRVFLPVNSKGEVDYKAMESGLARRLSQIRRLDEKELEKDMGAKDLEDALAD